MNDSINIVLVGIDYLDEIYLKKVLGIEDYKIFDNGAIGYSFTYKKAHFEYYKAFKNLVVETTTHKILNKKDILLQDKQEFIMRLNQILKEVLNQQKFDKLLLTQIDYCVDIYVGEDKLEEYIKVMNKQRSNYKRKIRKKRYKTSIQLTTDDGKLIKGYDKVTCIKDKAIKKKADIILKYKDKEMQRLKLQELEKQVQDEIPLYRGVIRLEIAVKKNNLKYYYKTSLAKRKKAKKAGKSKQEIEQIKIEKRTIDNYWTREKFQEQFLNEVKQYYYEGDYYKLSIAVKNINDSNYSKVIKTRLILFLCRIECVGIDRIKKIGIYSHVTMRNHIKRLNKIGINPITIDEDSKCDMLESLYILAVRQAKNVYFKQQEKKETSNT